MPKLPSDAGSESGTSRVPDAGRDATLGEEGGMALDGGLDGAVDATLEDAAPDAESNGSDGEPDDGSAGVDAGSNTPATED